jgi:hypothetical protein
MWSVAVNCPSSLSDRDTSVSMTEQRTTSGAQHLVAEPLVGHEILRIGGEQRARPLGSRPRPPDRAPVSTRLCSERA